MKNYFILTASSWGSLAIFFLASIFLFAIFIRYKKKQGEEQKIIDTLGRRGKKDHIWQILKEYHRKTNRTGSKLEEFFIFERPSGKEMHQALLKAHSFRDKQKNNRKFSFSKTKYPERFEIEDYFDSLEKETQKLRKTDTHPDKKKSQKRKRYVILYKINQKGVMSSYKAIEVELIKQSTVTGSPKDCVMVNGEMDAQKELQWIEPLLQEKIKIRESSKNKKKGKKSRSSRA